MRKFLMFLSRLVWGAARRRPTEIQPLASRGDGARAFLSPDGRLFFSIAGADDGDDDGDEDGDGDDDSDDDADADADDGDDSDDDADDDSEDSDDEDDEVDEDELPEGVKKVLRKERKARREAERALKREKRKGKKKPKAKPKPKPDEGEDGDDDGDEGETPDDKATEKLRKANLLTALVGKGYKGDRAKALVRLLDVDYDDNDEPEDLDDAIEEAADKYGKSVVGKGKSKQPRSTNGGDGNKDGERPSLTADEQKAAKAFGMSEEEYAEHKKTQPKPPEKKDDKK